MPRHRSKSVPGKEEQAGEWVEGGDKSRKWVLREGVGHTNQMHRTLRPL